MTTDLCITTCAQADETEPNSNMPQRAIAAFTDFINSFRTIFSRMSIWDAAARRMFALQSFASGTAIQKGCYSHGCRTNEFLRARSRHDSTRILHHNHRRNSSPGQHFAAGSLLESLDEPVEGADPSEHPVLPT